MFTTVAQTYTGWSDTFTGEHIPAEVTTNSIGFRDDREFDFSKPYEKGPKEKVVLFTGGSAAWGVGATHGDTTIPGRMQHYLNEAQDEYNYTVVNLGMGSYIAYQQAIALDLWGKASIRNGSLYLTGSTTPASAADMRRAPCIRCISRS